MLALTKSDTNKFCPWAMGEKSMTKPAQTAVLTARIVFILGLRFCLYRRGDNSLLGVYTGATRHASQIHVGVRGQRRRQGGGRSSEHEVHEIDTNATKTTSRTATRSHP